MLNRLHTNLSAKSSNRYMYNNMKKLNQLAKYRFETITKQNEIYWYRRICVSV